MYPESTDNRTLKLPVHPDTESLLFRISPIDGTLQRYIPTTLRPGFLHLCLYSLLAGHPGERLVYDTVRQHFCSTIYPMLSTVQKRSASRAH